MAMQSVWNRLKEGCVIPAHPLALTPQNKLDERCQRALTRYYLAAGAGGVAVGVHTTQFAIHDPKVGLYKPVLELAAQTASQAAKSGKLESPILVAGLVGDTAKAVREAQLAVELGYHLGLLSLTALRGKSIDELIDHATHVADVIPIMGFYLQSTISHMVLPKEFWSRLVEIPNVRAIKIAPFNRYQTLGCAGSGGAVRAERRDRSVHGQRRQHHRRSSDALRVPHGSRRSIASDCRGTAGPVGLLDQKGGREPRRHSRRFAGRVARSRRRCSRWPPS